MSRRLSIFGSTVLALFLAGCMVGPKYSRPDALPTQPVPDSYTKIDESSSTNNVEWKTARPVAHIPRGPWWEIFNDAELNRLESLASANNQELAIAAARFEQSRALVKVARSDLFPHLSVDPSLN